MIEEEYENSNVVKVVINKQNEAMYFSRSPIPFIRDKKFSDALLISNFYKHVGIYAYRTEVLKQIVKLAPTMLELSESLEQLRWIEHGIPIKVFETLYENISIDTPEDLLKLSIKK